MGDSIREMIPLEEGKSTSTNLEELKVTSDLVEFFKNIQLDNLIQKSLSIMSDDGGSPYISLTCPALTEIGSRVARFVLDDTLNQSEITPETIEKSDFLVLLMKTLELYLVMAQEFLQNKSESSGNLKVSNDEVSS
jgi:hypothetical protein